MKFRMRSLEIDAVRARDIIRGGLPNWPGWVKLAYDQGRIRFSPIPGVLTLQARDGKQRAGFNDWVILDATGDIYPCRDDIFSMRYERVTP